MRHRYLKHRTLLLHRVQLCPLLVLLLKITPPQRRIPLLHPIVLQQTLLPAPHLNSSITAIIGAGMSKMMTKIFGKNTKPQNGNAHFLLRQIVLFFIDINFPQSNWGFFMPKVSYPHTCAIRARCCPSLAGLFTFKRHFHLFLLGTASSILISFYFLGGSDGNTFFTSVRCCFPTTFATPFLFLPSHPST